MLNFVVDDIDEAVNTLLDGGVRLLRYEGLGLDMKTQSGIPTATPPGRRRCRQRQLRVATEGPRPWRLMNLDGRLAR